MKQAQHTLSVETRGKGLYEITTQVTDWVAAQVIDMGMETGLLTLYCRHTSASLTIQENADADVLRDLETFFDGLVPEDGSRYRHRSEGADDMPAHIRSALTDSSLAVPVSGGRVVLGTWQGVFLFEHRARPHVRQVVLHLAGE